MKQWLLIRYLENPPSLTAMQEQAGQPLTESDQADGVAQKTSASHNTWVQWSFFRQAAGELKLVAMEKATPLGEVVDQLPEQVIWDRLEQVVLVPGEDVSLLSADIPTNQTKQILRAVPYVLEDRLTEEVEELHFALGEIEKEKAVPVGVVQHEKMQRWVASLTEVGLQPTHLLPDTVFIPAQARDEQIERWYLVIERDRVLLRMGDYAALAMHKTQLVLLVTSALEDYARILAETNQGDESEKERVAALPEKLVIRVVYESKDQDAVRWAKKLVRDLNIPDLPVPVTFEAATVNVELFLWLAKRYIESITGDGGRKAGQRPPSTPLNLLQGTYKVRRQKVASNVRWQPFAVAVVVLMLINVSMMIGKAFHYESETVRLTERSEALYREIKPNARRIVDVKRQLEAQLNSANASGGLGFLALLQRIGEPVANISGKKRDKITLESFSYDAKQNLMRLDLYINSYPLLDQLEKEIRQKRLAVEIDSANEDKRGIRAKLKVRVNG